MHSGPMATSRYYIETDRHPAAYLLVEHSSRRYTNGSEVAFYTAVVLDKPSTTEFPRCVHVSTNYLKEKCQKVVTTDVPEVIKGLLENMLNRKEKDRVWDKQYVGV